MRRLRLIAVAFTVSAMTAAFGVAAQAVTHSQAVTTNTPRCLPIDLGIHYAGGQGATAMFISDFQFINVSHEICHLIGYPGLAVYSRTGARLSVKVDRESFTARRPAVVTLKPGGRASFLVQTSAFRPGPPTRCVDTGFLRFIAPDDDSTLSIRRSLLVCGGVAIGPVTDPHTID